MWKLKGTVEATCFITPEEEVPVQRLVFTNDDGGEYYLELRLDTDKPTEV